MKSALLIGVLASMAILVTMLPGGQCSDFVSDVNVTNITTSSARLVWQWSFDDDTDTDPIGCTIVTRKVDQRMKIVHEVELGTTVLNYTVSENLTSWERYESCVRPLLLNDSLGNAACSGYYVTEYNPWTQQTETAVIISAALIFALLIAVAINTRWPRTTRRNFSMDKDEGDDEEAKQSADAGGNINAAFYGDDDADSVVDDWNKAANIAALTSGRTRGEIPWIKSSETHQQINTMYDDVNDNHSQQPNIHCQQPESSYVNQHDQPGMPGTEQHTGVYSQQPNLDRQQPDNVYVTRPGTEPHDGVYSQEPNLDRQQPESAYPNLPGTARNAGLYSEAYGELPPGEGTSGQVYHGSGDPQYQGTGDQQYHDIPAQNQQQLQHPYHTVYQDPDYHHYSTHVVTIEGVDNGYF